MELLISTLKPQLGKFLISWKKKERKPKSEYEAIFWWHRNFKSSCHVCKKKKRSVVALAYAEHTRSKQKLNHTSGDVLRAHVSLTSAYFSRLNCDIIRHLQHRGGIWLFLASCDKGQASPKSASQAKPSQAMMEEIGETGRTYYTAGAKLEIG